MDLNPEGNQQDPENPLEPEVITPPPVQPVPQKKNNTWLIILIVVLAVLCCLCLLIIIGLVVWLGPVTGGVFSNIIEVNPVFP